MSTKRNRKEVTRVVYEYEDETACDLCGAWDDAVDYIIPISVNYNTGACVSMYLRKDVCDICWAEVEPKYLALLAALGVEENDAYNGRFDTDEEY